MKKCIFIIFILPLLVFSQTNQIIPKPQFFEFQDGQFSITPFTKIVIQLRKNKESEELQAVAQYLDNQLFGRDSIEKKYSIIHSKMMRPQRIVLSQLHYFKDLGNEGYKISIFQNIVIVSGNTAQGIFYGVQTLLQMAKPVKIAGLELYYTIPCATISDFPRFSWRGMHLDVVRHFFTVNEIKKYIDILALHKLNVFHWHLTDDQGWRIEIKKYSNLTEKGAYRENRNDENWFAPPQIRVIDKARYGGFYTQEDAKEIVNYAQKRFITVIPEINLPGHSMALVAAYPHLSCSKTKYEVPPRGFENLSEPLCPTDTVFRFLNDIFTEIFQIFPSKYIHIGGSDVNINAWKSSVYVKNLMLEKGFSSYNQVLSFFVKNIEKYATLQGKKIIGWDAIFMPAMSNTATLMCENNIDIGKKALQNGNEIIMIPNQFFNFNTISIKDTSIKTTDLIALENAYNFNPAPKNLSFEQSQLVLGIHGCVWTENIQTFDNVQSALLPKLSILCEVAWTLNDNKNYQDFSIRSAIFNVVLKERMNKLFFRK